MIDLDAIKARCEARDYLSHAGTVVPALVAEVERLTEEIMGYQVRDGYDKGHEHGQASAVAEVLRLRSEVERLRAALRIAEAEVERLRGEVEGLTDAYDQLKSDADAEVGRLRIKAGEDPIILCGMCDHPAHEGACSTVCDDECAEDWE